MSKVLAILSALLNLLDTYLKTKARKGRELTEQEIKENPRDFFQKGNNSSTTVKPDSVQPDTDTKD